MKKERRKNHILRRFFRLKSIEQSIEEQDKSIEVRKRQITTNHNK